MSLPPKFHIKINKAVLLPEEEAGIMTIVIMQPYVYLEKGLRSAFKGEKDVKIILDRRCEERRERRQAVALDRRKVGRRRPKEELVEVVVST